MITWTPDGTAPLVEANDDDTNIEVSVTAASDDSGAPVTSLSWSATPSFPEQFAVSTDDNNTLTLTIPDFVDVFQIQEIRYLLEGIEGVCTAWADLPVAAEDVVAFLPDPNDMFEFTLSVTAQPSGASQAYVIWVWANYSLGRDALVEAVNARRH